MSQSDEFWESNDEEDVGQWRDQLNSAAADFQVCLNNVSALTA